MLSSVPKPTDGLTANQAAPRWDCWRATLAWSRAGRPSPNALACALYHRSPHQCCRACTSSADAALDRSRCQDCNGSKMGPRRAWTVSTTRAKSGWCSERASSSSSALRPRKRKSTKDAKRPGGPISSGERIPKPPKRCGRRACVHCAVVRGVPITSPSARRRIPSASVTRGPMCVADEHLVRKFNRHPSRQYLRRVYWMCAAGRRVRTEHIPHLIRDRKTMA